MTEPTTPAIEQAEIERLSELLAKATPGDWQSSLTDTPYEELGESWVIDAKFGSICTLDGPRNEREANAGLITAAVNALPAILEAARQRQAFEAREARLREALEGLVRYAEAVRLQHGIGKNQQARLDAAKTALAQSGDGK